MFSVLRYAYVSCLIKKDRYYCSNIFPLMEEFLLSYTLVEVY